MRLASIAEQFANAGCTKLYAKPLAANDNSKNQVYFGPGFQAVNLFPNEGVFSDASPKNQIFKARLRFSWLLPNGTLAKAPDAQLVLYPQYPEVRFSGFLRGCAQAPSPVMASRQPSRVLFLGVTDDQQIIGLAIAANSTAAREFRARYVEATVGVFHELTLPNVVGIVESRKRLLRELRRINLLGWIDSKQLGSDGTINECNASQCGGFTLEAELGIPKNSKSEPDYLGWEVKQHSVANFDHTQSGVVTLMTPEPSGGFYKDKGPEAFVRRFGYADKKGREDRLNFGGVHRIGKRHLTTGLTLTLTGYDFRNHRITDAEGHLALINDEDEIAAKWPFSSMLEHWSRKHSKAVYVPSLCRTEPARQYQYGNKVRLAERTDSLQFLHALADGSVYYDPGIKLENASSDEPNLKRRSQFRIRSKSIAALYESVELVEV